MKKITHTQFVNHGQKGAALAMAMVVLVILTILGISSMKSSSLEFKMATGIKDNTMAFQAAESGLVEAFSNVVLDKTQTTTTNYEPSSQSGVKATTVTSYIGWKPAEASTKPSGSDFGNAYFSQVATGETSSGAKVIIHQGARITSRNPDGS